MEPEKKHNTDLSNVNIDPISYFSKDEGFVLAYKKTEKLASALYMVTNLFSDNESIKWTLRKKVADMLSFILTYKDTPELSLNDFVYNVKTRVLEQVSLLEISLRGGLLSQMNFSVLKHEFNNLINILDSGAIPHKNPFDVNISRSFLDVSRDVEKVYLPDSVNITQRTSLGETKDPGSGTLKDGLKRSNRQNTILALLKKKKEINIKDIASIIKDCSEKTIQRELNSFISMGVIKRVGVRRWSKYFLV